MRRYRCAHLPPEGGRVILSPAVSHHALRVTGLHPGEALEVFDGRGHAARGHLVGVEAGLAVVELGPLAEEPPRPYRILGIALLKGPAMDLSLRMATELGVDEIRLIQADRSVVKGDGKPERWARLLESAAGQSGRARLPQLHPPTSLADALERPLAPVDARLTAGDLPIDWRICLPGGPLLRGSSPPLGLLVGPEGGWTDVEVELALHAGAQPMGLGPCVLRADTAVAVALARGLSDDL